LKNKKRTRKLVVFQDVDKTFREVSAADPIEQTDAIPYGSLKVDTIQLTVDIPILGGAAQSVAADVVGTPEFARTTVKLDSEVLKHLKSAKVIIDFAWAATADGTIQLYDRTAGAVRGETATLVGGESSEWSEFSVTGLVAGNEMCIRANVTVAGAAGEVVSLYRVILRLILGVS